MADSSSAPARRRPVFIANFRAAAAPPAQNAEEQPPAATRQTVHLVTDRYEEPGGLRAVRSGLRYDFPAAGPVAEGGHCDGYLYRIPFAAGRVDRTYDLVLAFLNEQGYGDVPLPKDVAELRRFRLPQKLRHQLSLFGEDGYVHNPVKILFPTPAGRRGELILELYNEGVPGHLLKFHRR